MNQNSIPSKKNTLTGTIVPYVPEFRKRFQWHYISAATVQISIKMRVAHLILTYTDPRLTERLIQKTQHRNADFYIHVDKKNDFNHYLYLKGYANVYFINKRADLKWAGFSTVLATFNCIKEIAASGIKYEFINFLSGQDYPLKTANAIDDFFQKNIGSEFLSYRDIRNEWKEGLIRMESYFFNDYEFPGKFLLEKLLKRLLPKRKIPYDLHPYGNSMFWMLSPEAALYVVKTVEGDKKLRQFFSLCWGTDEFVFQTILMNSVYKDRIVNTNSRYIDWSAGGASPKTLDLSDAARLSKSDMLFARKFDLKRHPQIIDFIDQQILSNGTSHKHTDL